MALALVHPHSLAIEFSVTNYPEQAIKVMTDHAWKTKETFPWNTRNYHQRQRAIISFHFQIEKKILPHKGYFKLMTGNFTPMPIESQSMKTGVYASLRLLKIYSVTVLSICILIIHTGRKGFQLLSNDMKMAHNGSNYSTINKIHKSSLQKYLAYLSCSLKSHKRSTSEIPVYQTPKTYPLYLAAYIMVKEEMEKNKVLCKISHRE